MGAFVTARQVLQWNVRTATSSALFSPVRFGCCHLQLLSISRRLCSSCSEPTLQSNHHEVTYLSEKHSTELSLSSLVGMGFTDSQAEQIYETVSKVKRESTAKHALSALSALFVLGLSNSTVVKVLKKCPQLYTINESLFQQRIGNLRRQGFVEGSLQRVVSHYPQILMVPRKKVNYVVMFLREKCLFTVQQVTEILRDSPAVIEEDLGEVEYKFQYVYFRMGVKQAAMVKAKLFRFTLNDVRSRHSFLEYRGLYQTPDKKGQTLIVNPKLTSILSMDQHTFLAQVAKASAEEYDVFQRLMAREWEAEEHRDNFEAVSDDDEEESDEENERRQAYMRRKKFD